jgi:hypothetical protein
MKRIQGKFLFGLLTCTALVGGTHEARADDVSKARELFAKAELAESNKKYDEAIELYRKVLEIKSSASVLIHMARCEEALLQFVEAKQDYERAKREAAGKSQADLVRDAESAISGVTARMPRMGVKCVSKSPCSLSLDGKPFDGIMDRMNPGTHIIEARTTSGGLKKRDVTLREADVMDLEVVVVDEKPLPGQAVQSPVPPTAVRAPSTVTPAPSVLAPTTSAPLPSHGASKSYVAPIVLTGLTVLLAGAGAVAYVIAADKQDEGRANCASLLVCDKSRSTVRLWDALALSGFSGAAVAGGFAVYFFVKPAGNNETATAGLRGTLQW